MVAAVELGIPLKVGPADKIVLDAIRRTLAKTPPLLVPGDGEAHKAAVSRYREEISVRTQRLAGITPGGYRDKKTYSQLVGDVEEGVGDGQPPDYSALREALLGRLEELGGAVDPIATWRLHHALAEIAEKEGLLEDAKEAYRDAIETYPDVRYSAPRKQSKLQHLYNAAALCRARKDVLAGEEFLIDRFSEDDRFLYVFVRPWVTFYEANGHADRLPGLWQRLAQAYTLKAERLPKQEATLLEQYRSELPDRAGSR